MPPSPLSPPSRAHSSEPVSPELVLVDPVLAARERERLWHPLAAAALPAPDRAPLASIGSRRRPRTLLAVAALAASGVATAHLALTSGTAPNPPAAPPKPQTYDLFGHAGAAEASHKGAVPLPRSR